MTRVSLSPSNPNFDYHFEIWLCLRQLIGTSYLSLHNTSIKIVLSNFWCNWPYDWYFKRQRWLRRGHYIYLCSKNSYKNLVLFRVTAYDMKRNCFWKHLLRCELCFSPFTSCKYISLFHEGNSDSSCNRTESEYMQKCCQKKQQKKKRKVDMSRYAVAPENG